MGTRGCRLEIFPTRQPAGLAGAGPRRPVDIVPVGREVVAATLALAQRMGDAVPEDAAAGAGEEWKGSGKGNRKRATAQEPIERMKYGETWRLGTLNVKGLMRQGKREEVETWTAKKNKGERGQARAEEKQEG